MRIGISLNDAERPAAPLPETAYLKTFLYLSDVVKGGNQRFLQVKGAKVREAESVGSDDAPAVIPQLHRESSPFLTNVSRQCFSAMWSRRRKWPLCAGSSKENYRPFFLERGTASLSKSKGLF